MENKTPNPAQEYARLLRERLGPRLKQVTLFGSHARGDSWEGSDWDMLVVVDRRTPEVREMILDAEVEIMNRYDELLATLLYDEAQWRRARQFPIGFSIQRDGIAV